MFQYEQHLYTVYILQSFVAGMYSFINGLNVHYNINIMEIPSRTSSASINTEIPFGNNMQTVQIS